MTVVIDDQGTGQVLESLMSREPNSPQHRILRLPDVVRLTGMKRSWLYRESAAGRFPRQVKIGRASGWDAHAVDEWIAERLKG